MTTDGFSRDRVARDRASRDRAHEGEQLEREQLERSQEHRARRRRDDRSRRRRVLLMFGLGLVLLLVASAPSLVCCSPMGRSMVASAAVGYGWDARVENLRIGWVTPLRLDGLELRGTAAKSEISIQQIETELTIMRLLSAKLTDLGEITARGVVMSAKIADGSSSLEEDLAPLMSGPSSDTVYTANIHLQDVGVIATDAVTEQAWKLSQSNADLEMNADGISAQFAGVLTEPSGSGGALQGSAAWNPQPASGRTGEQASEQPIWQLRLQCESLPISIVSLARRRVGEAAAAIPAQIAGDSTGRLSLDGFADGRMLVSPEQIEIRNFTAADPSLGEQVWSNRMATLDGVLVVDANRIIGRQFQVGTDFAFASMDGSISTALSIAGTSDNPVLWLDALNGVANAEVDLAMLNRALPGIMPLKDGAEIVSGKISARIDTLPSDASVKRSQLKLESQPIRARTASQNVLIEPVACVATVVNDRGHVSAEGFQLDSTFAKATGRGDMQSGSADVEIDFGRLVSTLQPLVDLSENNLAGSAKGNIRWNATADNVWQLNGVGQASNVLVVLPGGQSFSRPALSGEVLAVGKWDGQALSELTQATCSVASTGIKLDAALVAPVRAPSAETLMPIQVRGSGRVESLTDIAGPWLPAEIHDCEGGFDLVASGEVSATRGQVTNVLLTLADSRLAYGDRYFTQPKLELKFDGTYAWPSGDLVSRDCTVQGTAITAALKGESTAAGMNLELAWNAKLERIQGSVRQPLATSGHAGGIAQPVGFRGDASAASEDWLVKGDYTGNMIVKSQDEWLDIQCQSSGTNLAVMQPASSGTSFNTVGPALPTRTQPATTPTTVWSEPNFKLDGHVRYQTQTGEVVAEELQLSSDWFAASLAGRMLRNDNATSIELRGPGKLKMEEVGRLLTSLSGTPIQATGLHETPLEILVEQSGDQEASLNVTASLGWESAEVGGVVIGPTSIPVKMTGTTLFVEPATVPLAQGKINLAGEVHYRPGPIWIRATPGRFAESVRLTREMNERWLKYLTPLAADAAQIDGVLGVTLDEAIIVLDAPEKNRVVGRMDIEGITMSAGPLSNQIISGVAQLKALAKATTPETPPADQSNKTLVTMPAQTVDFSMIDGVVSHQRLFFQIDRAQIVTSGRVDMNSRLNMVAQIPLDARWLGRDLQGLAGQSVNLPIDGTLSHPRLDAAGVRQVVTQLGTQAIQNAADNFLQQNLSKGLDKLFGN